jgi:hypothetical protein
MIDYQLVILSKSPILGYPSNNRQIRIMPIKKRKILGVPSAIWKRDPSVFYAFLCHFKVKRSIFFNFIHNS